jgi:hypothetical protein
MTAYRTYLLDLGEHIQKVVEHEAEDDAGALSVALALGAEHAAVEVWEHARLVVRVGAEFSLEA